MPVVHLASGKFGPQDDWDLTWTLTYATLRERQFLSQGHDRLKTPWSAIFAPIAILQPPRKFQTLIPKGATPLRSERFVNSTLGPNQRILEVDTNRVEPGLKLLRHVVVDHD